MSRDNKRLKVLNWKNSFKYMNDYYYAGTEFRIAYVCAFVKKCWIKGKLDIDIKEFINEEYTTNSKY